MNVCCKMNFLFSLIKKITTAVLRIVFRYKHNMYACINNRNSCIITYETRSGNKDILNPSLNHIYKHNELKKIDLWFICLPPSNKESIMTGIINEFRLYLIYMFCFGELFLGYLVLINIEQQYTSKLPQKQNDKLLIIHGRNSISLLIGDNFLRV